MALLNNIYIFVETEEISYGVEATSHPVETGIDVTDHVRRKPFTVSLTGEIVGTDAGNKRGTIVALHQKGALCKYVGRNVVSNCIIEDFSTSHPYDVWGGCKFNMTLKEIRTAGRAYKATSSSTKTVKATTKAGTQQVTSKSSANYVTHTVKKGDTIWALVAASSAPYKNLSRPAINGKTYSACDWVMQMNPDAFSRAGDFKTLQVGKKIKVGVRANSGNGGSRNGATTYARTTASVR